MDCINSCYLRRRETVFEKQPIRDYQKQRESRRSLLWPSTRPSSFQASKLGSTLCFEVYWREVSKKLPSFPSANFRGMHWKYNVVRPNLSKNLPLPRGFENWRRHYHVWSNFIKFGVIQGADPGAVTWKKANASV